MNGNREPVDDAFQRTRTLLHEATAAVDEALAAESTNEFLDLAAVAGKKMQTAAAALNDYTDALGQFYERVKRVETESGGRRGEPR